MVARSSSPATLCPICHTSNRNDARFCQKCGNNILLNDRYRIVRAIKEGGMGAVYEAIDSTGKRYALKALIDRFTDPAERTEAIERFQEEASILRELKHPQVPRVYGSFLHGGRYYLAMDFVDGIDLEDLQRKQPNQRFDEPTVLRWADQIAGVLDYLHERRLIYRDMKPSNVMIENGTGNVKVVDFGIAKLFQPTQRGTLIGTPGYSPPEQYQGQATPQSDVYALGATLHHLLTGRDPRDEPPFSFPPVRELVPSISPETEAAIMRALAMELDKRWPSAAAFRAALPMERLERKPKSKPQPTVALDPAVAASIGTIPQPQQGRQQPARQPKPAKRPKRAKSKQPAPVPTPRPKRRGGLAAFVIIGALIAIALGIPQINQRLSGLISNTPAATVAPTGVQLVPRQYTTDVIVTVPASATDQEIRDAIYQAYDDAVVNEFGALARINTNIPLSEVGARQTTSGTDSQEIRVRVQGTIAAPAQ